MGTDKAFIDLGGETIVERAVRVLAPLFDDFFIVANDIPAYRGLGPDVYPDIIEGAGSLGGVYTALERSAAGWCFVAACDMPLLDAGAVEAVVEAALERADRFDVVVPFCGGRTHPMHGAYRKGIAGAIGEMIRSGELRINELLGRVRTLRLDAGYFSQRGVDIERSVANVNTAGDLERLGIEVKTK